MLRTRNYSNWCSCGEFYINFKMFFCVHIISNVVTQIKTPFVSNVVIRIQTPFASHRYIWHVLKFCALGFTVNTWVHLDDYLTNKLAAVLFGFSVEFLFNKCDSIVLVPLNTRKLLENGVKGQERTVFMFSSFFRAQRCLRHALSCKIKCKNCTYIINAIILL